MGLLTLFFDRLLTANFVKNWRAVDSDRSKGLLNTWASKRKKKSTAQVPDPVLPFLLFASVPAFSFQCEGSQDLGRQRSPGAHLGAHLPLRNPRDLQHY